MARKKLYSDEELKERKREYNKLRYQKKKDEIRKNAKEYYYKNIDKQRERHLKYYQQNKENILNKLSEYYQNNKEQRDKYTAEYRNTQKGRAFYLCKSYIQKDKKHNRGECTLTAQWIVENIFSQPCHYCGETDWTKLGCDRIDNDLPHTPDNVVCCCRECNIKRGSKTFEEFTKDLNLL